MSSHDELMYVLMNRPGTTLAELYAAEKARKFYEEIMTLALTLTVDSDVIAKWHVEEAMIKGLTGSELAAEMMADIVR